MIEFVSEEIRTQFHLLPAEDQKLWEELARKFLENGRTFKIYYVDQPTPGSLEASIRINKEFDVRNSSDNIQLNLPGLP